MMYGDVVRDFARRTRANLHAIDVLRDQGHEVFEATQLVNSTLGLLVFPQQRYLESIPETPVAELQRIGWPVPRMRACFDQAENLRQLIRYLRNAVAHFNIEFVGDAQNQRRAAYDFKSGVITSLNGSGGLIKDHGDVTNEAVTYAFAAAVART